MLFGKYRFVCSFVTEAILPEYKGSTFRGVFGRSLKSAVCAAKKGGCEPCLLKRQCLYPAVFETPFVRTPPEVARIRDVPHPFVIEPPATTETRFSAGSSFDFSLLLFGEHNNSLPYFIFAVEQMGRHGIGRPINGGRGRFVVDAVTVDGKRIYRERTGFTENTVTLKSILLSAPVCDTGGFSCISVILKTPLRFKSRNRLSDALPFQELVRLMMRRASALLACYSGREPQWDYRGMLSRAKSVGIRDADLAWTDWRRYSMRQKQGMELGGLTGRVAYEGRIGEFMPLLEFSALVHIGKQTTFGLGKVGVSAV